jgi:hypothetical protein
MSQNEAEAVRLAALAHALDLMTQSLDILDDNDVSGDIGAHLDLALTRLRTHLELPEPARADQINAPKS